LPESDRPVLILGGTKEAATLATILVERGLTVTSSLAGRTREPSPLKGNVRVGGFGGAQGLSTYLKDNRIALLIDMTHPFAVNMSLNAQQAAEMAGVNLISWQRPAWQRTTHDNWQSVRSIEQAVTAIPANARALLALGSQHIAPFATRPDVHFLVRMVDPPKTPIALADYQLLLAKPGSVEQEFALFKTHKITHIICRNSGGQAAYTKIAAARLLKLPVIMIEQSPTASSTRTFDAMLEEIFSLLQ
jgi:precorrin-6A/cobalt-precorrin-6A reductase